jgi:hypothetical protein
LSRSSEDAKGARPALNNLAATLLQDASVASTDRCKRSGFLLAVKDTDAPNENRFVRSV